ncbi:MAG: hypothetical protein HC910_05735 [Spirulinaceae cyanobacterium SM2_1_0]|nr:hypothetical protein [Spirulinaceae cyanobacterium SM2_1_0]
MWIVIVALNCLIAGLNFYAAWYVWSWRRGLAAATRGLVIAERSTHNVLAPAPRYIKLGQQGTRQLRDRYGQLEVRVARLQQLLAILLRLPGLWRRLQRRR